MNRYECRCCGWVFDEDEAGGFATTTTFLNGESSEKTKPMCPKCGSVETSEGSEE